MLTELINKIGTTKYEGSSMEQGVLYQELPDVECKYHRGGSKLRARRITELVDLTGKEVWDLGCSVGAISGILSETAEKVIGIDHDEDSINLAKAMHPECDFRVANIDKDFITSMPKTDVIVWTSQFMWMVKQYGMEYALDCLFELSKKCEYMIFETAGQHDGSAPIEVKQSEVLELLIMNTRFNKVKDCGPWNDLWTVRNVFLCRNLTARKNNISTIEYPKRGVVRKRYSNLEMSKELMNREIGFLDKLKEYGCFPKVLEVGENYFDMNRCGVISDWISDRDIAFITHYLNDNNIVHRDITPGNVLFNGEYCVLIDFAWAIYKGELTNYSYDLGGEFKCPYGFNDEYSIKKLQASLL